MEKQSVNKQQKEENPRPSEVYNNFINLYSDTRTLQFRLIPQHETAENIEQMREELEDEKRHEAYPEVKKIMDKIHKEFIYESLIRLRDDNGVSFVDLGAAWERIRGKDALPEEKQAYEREQAKVREAITAYFPVEVWKKQLTGSGLYKKNGYLSTYPLTKEEQKAVDVFRKFATYFESYNKNRANLYTAEAKSTAVAHRIVKVNFDKFMQNIHVYRLLEEHCVEVLEIVRAKYPEFDKLFEIPYYSHALVQEDINYYNMVMGEVNKQTNLYQQKNKTNDNVPQKVKYRRNIKMLTLFNQIMGEGEKKVVIKAFVTDDEVLDALQEIRNVVDKAINKHIENICYMQQNVDLNKIYVRKKKRENLSLAICKKWDVVKEALWAYYEHTQRQSTLKKTINAIERCMEKERYSFAEIQQAFDYAAKINLFGNEVGECSMSLQIKSLFGEIQKQTEKIKESEKEYQTFYDQIKKFGGNLQEDDISPIKIYLDAVLGLFHLIELFDYDESNGEHDRPLYGEINALKYELGEFIFVYNKTRNYVTKAVHTKKKMKLMFNCPEFCGGFAFSKMDNYCTTILRKNGKYYLAVLNKNNKPVFEKYDGMEDVYGMMIYTQVNDVKRFIPKCSLCLNEVKAHFATESTDYVLSGKQFASPVVITKELYDLYFTEYDKKKKFQADYLKKTGDAQGYREAVKLWIAFCMNFMKAYKSTANYDYSSLEPISKYERVDVFYNDLGKLTYAIDFQSIKASDVREMVRQNQLFLFQIYNKDFSEKSQGSKNLHTLYWEQLFSEENLKNTTFKLNGGAELFFRPAGIQNDKKYSHEQGSYLVNKTYVEDKNGYKVRKPVPNEVYKELCEFYNGRKLELSTDAKFYQEKVKVRKAEYEIVKDRRYTREQYEFHVPITINATAEGNGNINNQVIAALREHPEINIIGLDRGERNLITYSVINQSGQILDQGTLNSVQNVQLDEDDFVANVGFDYKQRLKEREGERQQARKDWKKIGTIKELKSGYLSQVVHVLCRLMVKYNAVLILEDLNVGFKRSRIKVERQVYQKFEEALISKLNYMVISKKESDIALPGGVLQGYQLTEKSSSNDKYKKQSGFLFYVPPGYTSQIDPSTGFVNVFNFKACSTAEKKKEFFAKFTDIFYDKERELFAFAFDYEQTGATQAVDRTKWTVYVHGTRHVWDGKERRKVSVNPEELLIQALQWEGIESYENLYHQILEVPAEHRSFWTMFFRAFQVAMILRDSKTEGSMEEESPADDRIISPVLNEEGIFFDSSVYSGSDMMPVDADTNGAYHIAMKGLMLIKRVQSVKKGKTDKLPAGLLTIKNDEWFSFIQNRKDRTCTQK